VLAGYGKKLAAKGESAREGGREVLAGVYKYLCPLYNYRYSSFRLTDKKRQEDGRCKKIYEKSPKTPFQRLIESAGVSGESKAELAQRKPSGDPEELNRRLNGAVKRLLKINREKDKVKQSSGQAEAV
jgi:hypothetical protein